MVLRLRIKPYYIVNTRPRTEDNYFLRDVLFTALSKILSCTFSLSLPKRPLAIINHAIINYFYM